MHLLNKVAVIILNYRNVEDTVACINSLIKVSSPLPFIFVCDNDSKDGSYECLRESFKSYREITIIQTGRNGGFAYGCNIGIKAALSNSDIEYFWLLNNDTIVKESCLEYLLKKMESDSNLGIVGCTIAYSSQPNLVQAYGGSFQNRFTLVSKHIGNGSNILDDVNESYIESVMDFVSGASMFVRRSVFETIGYLSERYFLYYEEADFTVRLKKKFKLGFAKNAVIYHKEGATIGSSTNGHKASSFSVYHICRSRILFASTHKPLLLPIVYLRLARYFFAELIKGDLKTANAVFRGALMLRLN